ncbi:hypothetical protein T484DRAFT_1898106 [Baffinella frigidus]|nr:hypothetical protein T484DRAFT_1898106 [Cryptophyta sp. CCMP2293]
MPWRDLIFPTDGSTYIIAPQLRISAAASPVEAETLDNNPASRTSSNPIPHNPREGAQGQRTTALSALALRLRLSKQQSRSIQSRRLKAESIAKTLQGDTALA